MGFPSCRHLKKRPAAPGGLAWLASEPYRLFFFSGALWSLIGVSLWPLFYAGKLGFYPGITHARLMIEAFGGAFVVGFLGTAGPRMASAPKLTRPELLSLFALHTASGICHFKLMIRAADLCFIAMLSLLLAALLVRLVRFRQEAPPPQLILALSGLLCGIAGAVMFQLPGLIASPSAYRLAGLLLYQGLLLPPVLGIGAFLFPRILGGTFGGEPDAAAGRGRLWRALTAGLLLVASFLVESSGFVITGYLLRSATAAGYLLLEVRWRRSPGDPPRGTLARGLSWALGTGLLGLATAGLAYPHHVALEHLLYIGGFGLLILVVASRVLFGHSGDLAGFDQRSGMARLLIFLAFLAATTRASAALTATITISHHQYAAWLWGLCVLLWIIWHARRFVQRDDE